MVKYSAMGEKKYQSRAIVIQISREDFTPCVYVRERWKVIMFILYEPAHCCILNYKGLYFKQVEGQMRQIQV